MRLAASILFTSVALVASATPAMAQSAGDALERIGVTISAANGPILSIDRGLRSGLRKGDSVVFRRTGLPPLVGVVRRVFEEEARVELEDLESGALVAIGMPGEVLVPKGRAIPDDKRVEHPPWKEPVGPWAPGKPLLAPAHSPAPEERASDLSGRVYTRYQYTDDAQAGRTYSRLWTGLDLDWSNPFERGGSVRFKGDVSFRDSSSGSTSGGETLLRLQRFSYRVGDNFEDPHHVEVGRFLSSLFPEFGLIDGVEYIRRLHGGDQVGGSIGFLPDYQDDLRASDDFQATMFYRWVDGPEEKIAAGAGYQKTWHGGTADRDLFSGQLNWIVTPRTTFRGSLLVDYYDSTAQLKSTGFELTELHASLNQRIGEASGASLYASYFAWPELLKNEFPVPPPTTISDQKLTRVGLNGWTTVADDVRLSGRVDGWSDEQRNGSYVDVRVDLRDKLVDQSQLSLSLYQTQGSFSDGLGARVQHTQWIGPATLRLGYETVRYTQDGFLGAQSDLLQHLFRFGVDARLAQDLELSFDADQRFGDEQDSATLGLRLTWRF